MDRPSYRPTRQAIEWAKAECARLDELKCNNMPNYTEARYIGFLAERYFGQWLRGEQIPHVRNGGADDLPDYLVDGHRTGVKCVGARERFEPRYACPLADRFRRNCPDYLFFAGHIGLEGEDVREILMLGGISAADFFRRAEYVPKGAKINPTTPAWENAWRLPAGELHEPGRWLLELDG